MPTPYKPEWEYTSQEWVKHIDHFFRSPEGSNKGELLKYFRAEPSVEKISDLAREEA